MRENMKLTLDPLDVLGDALDLVWDPDGFCCRFYWDINYDRAGRATSYSTLTYRPPRRIPPPRGGSGCR
jgi:hypothetical protein